MSLSHWLKTLQAQLSSNCVPANRKGRKSRRPRGIGRQVQVDTTTRQLESRVMLSGQPAIDWWMQPRVVADASGRIEIPNTSIYATPSTFQIGMDFSSIKLPNGQLPETYTVVITPQGASSPGTYLVTTPSEAPRKRVAALPEGSYSVSVTGQGGSQKVTVTQPIVVDDIVVVAIGDSYSSGEGAPEVFRAESGEFGGWAQSSLSAEQTKEHRLSHRSSFAASAQMALQLEESNPHTSVTFVFVAQSGAEISEGALGPYAGISTEPGYSAFPPMAPQLTQVEQILGSRPIDVMTMSFGGNDIGFANVIKALLFADPQDPAQSGGKYQQTLDALENAVLDGQGVDGRPTWNAVTNQLLPGMSFYTDVTSKLFDSTTAGLRKLAAEYEQLNARIQGLGRANYAQPVSSVTSKPTKTYLSDRIPGTVYSAESRLGRIQPADHGGPDGRTGSGRGGDKSHVRWSPGD